MEKKYFSKHFLSLVNKIRKQAGTSRAMLKISPMEYEHIKVFSLNFHCRQWGSSLRGLYTHKSLLSHSLTPEENFHIMCLHGFGEMIVGNSADMCAKKFSLMSMGGWAEGLACADLWARPPIGVSGINSHYKQKCISYPGYTTQLWRIWYPFVKRADYAPFFNCLSCAGV